MPAEKQPNLKPAAAAPTSKSADWWVKEIAKSYKAWTPYRDKAKKVIERYRDERPSGGEQSGKKFNILFANTETLRPAIYSKTPVPDIRRRFLDKDPVGRIAADVLQRSVSFAIDAYDCDAVLAAVNDDYTLPGFAVARVKYIPHLKQESKPGADGKPMVDERMVYQEVQSEYVAWDRFAMSRSRRWDRVWWEAFAEDLSKEEIAAKFGQAIADKVSYDRGEDGAEVKDATTDDAKCCRVWEVWNKRTRERFYVAEDNDFYLKGPESDPLKLEGFWPNPMPLWSVCTTNTLIPIPEYLMYQDQALELDDLTERIDVLTSALRRRGVYNAENKDVLADLVNAGDNEFRPVENWADLMAKGGLERIIAELPIDGIAKIVLSLYQARDQVKQTIYEVTGLADIIRGASNAAETATAQQIKGQYAGMRLGKRKDALAKFARGLLRLKAEIIAEKFRPEEFAEMTGLKLFMTVADKRQAQQVAQQQQAPAQPGQAPAPAAAPLPPEVLEMLKQPTWEEVIRILRSDKLRGFRIDIETDSTIQPDAESNKKAAVDIVTAITSYFQQVGPAVQSGAMPMATAKDLLMTALRTFPNAEKFEAILDGVGQGDKGPTPEMQAQQQQLQQQQAQLAEQKKQAEAEQQQAALAQRDLQVKQVQQQAALDRRALEVQHAEELLRLKQQLDAQGEQMQKQIDAIRAQAERDVVAAINEAKSLTERHVGTARGEVERMRKDGIVLPPEPAGPKKPRRIRIVDQADGSTLMEELLEEAGEPSGKEPAGVTENTEIN